MADGETPTLSLSAREVAQDINALDEITDEDFGILVVDTAADLEANFDELSWSPQVVSILVTDSSRLSVTVSQALNDGSALAEISGAEIGVTDTAANVLTNLEALAGDGIISSIGVSDTAAEVLNNSSAIAAEDRITSVAVVDTASSILAN